MIGYNTPNLLNLARNLPPLEINENVLIEILEDMPGDVVVPTEENTIEESPENVCPEEYVVFEEDSSDSKATEPAFKNYFRTILISNADLQIKLRILYYLEI
jgi:hypothetical protein